MKRKLFEEPVSEYEMLTNSQNQEDDNEAEPVYETRQPRRNSFADEVVEQYQDEEVAYDLEDDQQDIVNEAMVRLEQAELYKMLIKHDLFDGVDGNPIAKQNVQNELKEYIVERLQILLGIKPEKSARPTSMRVELPFNKMEIIALKDLANKLTKGASSEDQEQETAEAIEQVEEPAPKLLKSPPKLQGLKPLGRSTVQRPPIKQVTSPTKQVVQPTKQVVQNRQLPPKQSNVVVNKTKRKVEIPQYRGGPLRDPKSGEMITDEEMQIAHEQLQDDLARSQGKNPYEMDEQELIARNKTIKTQAISKKVSRIPMPSPDMVSMHLQQQQMNRMDQEQDGELPNILNRVLANK